MTVDRSTSILAWKRILLHILFWLSYVVFFGLIYGKYGNDYSWYFFESLCMLPFIMIATYTTNYGILPYYLKNRKLLPSVLLLTVLLFIITLGERIFLRRLNSLPITFDSLFGITFLYLMLETNFIVGIAFAIKIIKKWMEAKDEKHEMEKLNLEKELNQLKSQLHPHFLFNTMNNLYALSVEKSSKTSEGIAKVSELLRLILYECNEREILLSKEIKLLKDYIDLEKMRYENSVEIILDISGSIHEVKIAPMLLFSFAENCFKHSGIGQDGKHYIKMVIRASKGKFEFYTENSKSNTKIKSGTNKEGIGLKNVRKRLELIYPGNYVLKISEQKNIFITNLTIEFE